MHSAIAVAADKVINCRATAQVAAQRHGVLIVAMLLGAIIGLIFAIGVTDPSPGGQVVTMQYDAPGPLGLNGP